MATTIGRTHGQVFTVLVGNFPYGADPSRNLPIHQAPPPTKQAVAYQVINQGDGSVHAQNWNARLGGAISPKTASLTVADNDFSTGVVVLTLGDYELLSGVDFFPGGAVNATATNLAAAIDALPEFTSSALAAVVSIDYDIGPIDTVDFRALHHGTITNLTPLVPATGAMANGGPGVVAPDLI